MDIMAEIQEIIKLIKENYLKNDVDGLKETQKKLNDLYDKISNFKGKEKETYNEEFILADKLHKYLLGAIYALDKIQDVQSPVERYEKANSCLQSAFNQTSCGNLIYYSNALLKHIESVNITEAQQIYLYYLSIDAPKRETFEKSDLDTSLIFAFKSTESAKCLLNDPAVRKLFIVSADTFKHMSKYKWPVKTAYDSYLRFITGYLHTIGFPELDIKPDPQIAEDCFLVASTHPDTTQRHPEAIYLLAKQQREKLAKSKTTISTEIDAALKLHDSDPKNRQSSHHASALNAGFICKDFVDRLESLQPNETQNLSEDDKENTNSLTALQAEYTQKAIKYFEEACELPIMSISRQAYEQLYLIAIENDDAEAIKNYKEILEELGSSLLASEKLPPSTIEKITLGFSKSSMKTEEEQDQTNNNSAQKFTI